MTNFTRSHYNASGKEAKWQGRASRGYEVAGNVKRDAASKHRLGSGSPGGRTQLQRRQEGEAGRGGEGAVGVKSYARQRELPQAAPNGAAQARQRAGAQLQARHTLLVRAFGYVQQHGAQRRAGLDYKKVKLRWLETCRKHEDCGNEFPSAKPHAAGWLHSAAQSRQRAGARLHKQCTTCFWMRVCAQ